MKVAIVVGVTMQHDAISSAALQQAAALMALPEVDDVCVFTQGSDREHACRTVVTGNPWELVRNSEFRNSDVAIFHWGIHYALFDAITLLGGRGLPIPVVYFHNCTPASLVAEDHRANIARSIEQANHVISRGVTCWTYSEFNRKTLVEWGARESQIDWVTFPVPVAAVRSSPRDDDTVHLLSVGRLVPAKGAHVLVQALALLPAALLGRTRATIVSSTTFSSSDYRAALIERIGAGGDALVNAIRLVSAPSDAALMALYSDADVLVSTSFHEGLCVPVIEGYASGCRAIGTTAGNLPYIVIPPDPIVPPGDPVALAKAIEQVAGERLVEEPTYHQRRTQLVDSFSREHSTETLRRALLALCARVR